MKIIITLAVAAALAILAAVGFAYSGFYDVGASSPHSGPVSWLLSTTADVSVERRARDVEVPSLEDESLLLAGINDYEAMCVSCHGAPGREPEAVGKGLNPPAPDLAESAAHVTPAELFWVTRHGIKMTGMPAWGATHDAEDLWPVVALLVRLPELDATAYRALLEDAEGHGHHDAPGGQGHDHGDTQEMPASGGHGHGDSSGGHEHGDGEPGQPAGGEPHGHTHDDAAETSGESHDDGHRDHNH